MKKSIKSLFIDFGKNFKFYIDYILKLNFGELLVHFIEFVLVVLGALIVYIPIYLVKDLMYTIFSLFGEYSTIINLVFNILFNIIALVLCILAFLYLFNKRYEDLQNEIKQKEENKRKEKSKESISDLDLPKEINNK